MEASDEQMQVCQDYQRRTCLRLSSDDADAVQFIPLDVETGLEVRKLSAADFDRRFKPIHDYPIAKACKLYLSFAQRAGASDEALRHLGLVIPIHQKEITMATTAKTRKTTAATTEAKAPKAKTRKTTTAKTKAVKAKAVKTKAVKTKAKAKITAAARFQALIMEGKLTADQIFAEVQTEFGLDDKKRGYVRWYWNHLNKQGMKPPALKEEK